MTGAVLGGGKPVGASLRQAVCLALPPTGRGRRSERDGHKGWERGSRGCGRRGGCAGGSCSAAPGCHIRVQLRQGQQGLLQDASPVSSSPLADLSCPLTRQWGSRRSWCPACPWKAVPDYAHLPAKEQCLSIKEEYQRSVSLKSTRPSQPAALAG